ncbi:sigma factor regulator N-terminal domain-containing protein [Streptococcus hongkongensis]|nr:hypothetical protein NC01_05790 [Streptococcus uberis]
MTPKNYNDPLAKLAIKRKRLTLLKTVLFSLLACLLLILICFKGLSSLTAKNGQKVYHHFQQLSEIAYPNISYDSLYYYPSGQFTGKVHADRFKDIDGIPISYSPFEANYSLSGTFESSAEESSANSYLFDRGTRQKVPQFFNTNVKFENGEVKSSPSHDLPYVTNMPNQLIEMAITFDKPYTYKELKTMLPKNLKKNWLWIGSKTTLDTSTWATSYQFGTNPEVLDNPQHFLKNLKLVSKEGSKVIINNVDVYSDLDNYVKEFQNTQNGEQLTFSGIILTGKSENFKELEGKKWIYASSIGANIDNKAYYKLEVN